jgi:ABC-type antimicrobial peptide transport system permease subunit
MPVSQVQTLDEVLSSALAQPRFAMVLLGAFAALALGLAVVGIYGVLAYSVSRRTGEIGIRLALGARADQVVGLVVRQGFGAALAGVVAGTAVAWYLSDLVSGMLYGVEPQDPITFATVPTLLLAVALVACWIPAGRATRVRPASALRHE